MAEFVEAKHRRDSSGRFGSGTSGGAVPQKRVVKAAAVAVDPDGARHSVVGRTTNGRIVAVGSDGKRRTFDARTLTLEA